jgi:NAD(P)-dependent dehydrogenase (short-subunit alcohol dehydrogenase family)
MPSTEGHVAIVTGASRGIGLAIAERLVRDGWRVCLTARNAEPLESAVKELGGTGYAIGVAGKADDPEHQDETVSRTVAEFGRLDLLVNNAGINPVYGPLLEQDAAAVRKVFEVNVFAVVDWVRRAYDAGLGEARGSIVNVASFAGLYPAPGLGAYAVSKAALIHLTRQLAVELAPLVRVNAVAPAVVRTKFARALYEGREEEASGRYPLGRLGVPEDVAGAVAYLAAADAAWVTGQTIVLDGGLTQTATL